MPAVLNRKASDWRTDTRASPVLVEKVQIQQVLLNLIESELPSEPPVVFALLAALISHRQGPVIDRDQLHSRTFP